VAFRPRHTTRVAFAKPPYLIDIYKYIRILPYPARFLHIILLKKPEKILGEIGSRKISPPARLAGYAGKGAGLLIKKLP
jgi:hypothetical protein